MTKARDSAEARRHARDSDEGLPAGHPRGLKGALFAAITLCIPLAFFVALEGGLRLAGVGSGAELFVEAAPQGPYLRMNPEVGRRFYPRGIQLPGVTHDPFLRTKPADGYRIVVQGASTVLGFPYFYGGAFPRMLERRLEATFPQRNVEVINTGMVAVNSYTLRDFVPEIVAIEPDAVLIYAAHNEYHGVLGVASTQALGGSRTLVRAWLAVQRLRTIQVMRGLVEAVRGSARGEGHTATDGAAPEWSTWSEMVPLDSPLYRRGVEQFRRNLDDIVDRYERAGIPVFLATVVSNERDLRPFVSEVHPRWDEAAWAQATETARELLGDDDLEAARSTLEALAARDSLNAEAVFAAARLMDGAGDAAGARRLYRAARDRDHLRFRAPSALNAVVREAASRPGVHLVEIEEGFEAASAEGIVGGALVAEHVHPTLEGAFLIAHGFYEALRQAEQIGPWDGAVDREAARADLPVTVVDSLYGEYVLHSLTSGWPFRPGETVGTALPATPPEEPVERLAYHLFRQEMTWPQAIQELFSLRYDAGNMLGARDASRALAQEYPELATPLVMWTMASLGADLLDEAVRLAREAHARSPSHRTALFLGAALVVVGQPDQGIAHLEEARAAAPPDEPEASAALEAARRLDELGRAVEARPADPDLLLELAEAYRALFLMDRAEATLERLLDVAPGHVPSTELLRSLGREPSGSTR